MASFADDIVVKLIAATLVTALEKDIFINGANLPMDRSKVGPFTSINDTGGTSAIREHDGKYPRPSLQIVVRASSAVFAKAKAEAIHALLDGLYNVTINGRFYQSITAVQNVLDMQKDEVGRSRFGFNIDLVSWQ